MRTFVINMDSAVDRWEFYKDKGCTRWAATAYDELSISNPEIARMVSYHNIRAKEHLCKVACMLSHVNLWRYIASNEIDDVTVIEDDAELVNHVPEKFPQDGLTYLGGYFSNIKVTDGPRTDIELSDGIHVVDHKKYRVLMTVAYYIPNWRVATKLVENFDRMKRTRAIDIMIREFTGISLYVSYPASFREQAIESQIRKKKKKFSSERYGLVGSHK
jgi:GR25 family glycosyltransferase involved in LPS biosynthesis